MKVMVRRDQGLARDGNRDQTFSLTEGDEAMFITRDVSAPAMKMARRERCQDNFSLLKGGR